MREREEQRERQRLQEREQRQQREQRRRDRPERPNERQFFADTPRPPRGKDDGPRSGPRPGGGQPSNAPRPAGQTQDRKDGRPPNENRGRDDRRGPRPPRRDSGGPALRLYATTETKGDAAADSPFAKLLELKLGGKK